VRLDRETRLPIAEVVRVIADLAEALAYAHTTGVVHRDIKPENVFWYRERALLSDFGIACATAALPSAERLTATGMVVGTLAYLSPEQAEGRPTIDGRADLYSLGCMAFELLSGKPPFPDLNPIATLGAHLTAPIPDVRTLRGEVPAALAELIAQLMAKRPEERPASAASLVEVLRSVESGSRAAATVATPEARARPRRGSPEVLALSDRAEEIYLRAVHGGEGARDKLQMARIYLEKALALEPDNALVLAQLADVTLVLSIRGFNEGQDGLQASKSLMLRALASDDSVGEVHSSLGATFLYWEDDFETGGQELRQGAELSPANPMSRRLYGAWLKIAGRPEEALTEMQAAVRLAPSAPFMHVGLGDVLMALGRYQEAIRPLREALRLSPKYDAALERLEMSCHRGGRHDEALDARRVMLGLRGATERMALLTQEASREGWPASRERDLRRELSDLVAQAESLDPFRDVRGSRQLSDRIIIVLAELGEWTQAMDWVERGYHHRPGRLRRVLTDLPYDRHGLATDARYVRLLRTAGLAELI
jgi:tetratricopeptide (TPR) repeat protein